MTKPLWQAEELQHVTQMPVTLSRAIYGVSIDTRTLNPGDLFVALIGPYQNGHDYILQAYQQGAAAALVSQHIESIPADFLQIVVPDTYQAFCELASYARNRAQYARVIGLTGSFGKTSCREALKHVLQNIDVTYATERNFNNQWGVPLSLSLMPENSRFSVLEMGMNHGGEITPLTQLVRPHIGLITTIGNAHIGNFDSIDEIADAKAEIFNGMAKDAVAVLNHDNAQYDRLATAAYNQQLRVLSFGCHPNADIRLHNFEFQYNNMEISVDAAGLPLKFTMNVLGDHWAWNMSGVLACIYALGQDLKIAAQSLQSFTPLAGRGQVLQVAYRNQHIQIIDDTYNGGPQAMQAALQVLGRLNIDRDSRRVAVLGDMNDLGEHMVAEHQALASLVTKQPIDAIYLYGPYMKHLHDKLPQCLQGNHFTDMSDLITALIGNVQAGDGFLVKGGHGQRAYDGIMQQVVHALMKLASTELSEKP